MYVNGFVKTSQDVTTTEIYFNIVTLKHYAFVRNNKLPQTTRSAFLDGFLLTLQTHKKLRQTLWDY